MCASATPTSLIKMSSEKESVSFCPLDPHLTDEYKYVDESRNTSLHNELEQLWRDSFMTDITIVIDGDTYPCHRVILAASSPYFKALFYHAPNAAKHDRLELPGLTPTGFSSMLEFFYTGHLLINVKNAVDVLEAADFLQYREIAEICFGILEQHMNPENCLAIARIGEAHLCHSLYETAKDYAVANFELIIFTKYFMEIPFEMVFEFLSIGKSLKIKRGKNLLWGICKWIKHKESRQSYKETLLRLINFIVLDKEAAAEMLVDFEFLTEDNLKDCVFNCDSSTIQHADQMSEDNTQNVVLKRFPIEEVLVMVPQDTSRKGTNIMHVYNERDNRWQNLSKLPFTLRCLYTVSSVDNDLYICGGEEFEIPKRDMFRFDIETRVWTEEHQMLIARSNHSAARLNKKLYVVGGKGSTNYLLRKDGEVYDTFTKQWTILPDLLGVEGIGRCVLLPFQGKLFVFGGTCTIKDIWRPILNKRQYKESQFYDPQTNSFYAYPALSDALECGRISVGAGDCFPYHGFMLIIDEDTKGKRMKLFNPVTGKLTDFLKTHGQHRFGGYLIMNEHMFCVGGVMDKFRAHDLVHRRSLLDGDGDWEPLAPLPSASSHHTCLSLLMSSIHEPN